MGAFPVFALEIPPTKCTKLGQSVIYKNRRYTCIRKKISGKWQLAWDQGVPIPKPQITPTPTPSTQPSAKADLPVKEAPPIEKIEIQVAKSSDLALGKNLAVKGKNRFGNLSGYILYRGTKGVIAMSDICQHKGCSVDIDKTGLLCPCHNALFDNSNGDVIRGPASYPLDRVPVVERDGNIYILD